MSKNETHAIGFSVNNKLVAPRCSEVLHRNILVDFLDSVSSDLIWMSAPGGAGKTTLVVDWVTHYNKPHIWLKLDSSDSSLGTFFYNLAQAARYSFPSFNSELYIFTQEYSLAPYTFAIKLFDALFDLFCNDKAILILDDYHELTETSPVHEIISSVVEKRGNKLRLVIISRHSLPQPFLIFKTNNRMMQLGWHDIKFNQADTKQLLEREFSREFSPEILNYIQKETDGWISGIRLISSKIYGFKTEEELTKKNNIEMLKKEAFNYFALDFFAGFSSELKKILIRTSFFPFFTSDMASEVSDVKVAFIYLEELVRKNFFLQSHQGVPIIYSYHPLFRDFLNDYARSNLSDKEILELSYVSARMLSEVSAFDQAIEIFIKYEFYDEACLLINEQSETFLKQGRVQQLLKWFNEIPEGVISNEPKLLIILANGFLLSEPEKACEIFLRVIKHYIDKGDKSSAIEMYGVYLEALSISGRDYNLLENSLYSLEKLLDDPTTEVLRAAENIACVVLCSTSFFSLRHPLQNRWKKYAQKAIQSIQDPASLIKACNNMMIYYRFVGEDHSTYHLLDILRPFRELIDSIPVLKLQTQVIDAFHNGYVLGKGEEAANICMKGIQEGISTGIHLYEFWFRYILVLTLLRDEKTTEAEEQILLFLTQYSYLPPVRKADILTLSGMCALYKRDLYKAQYDLQKANDIYVGSSANFPVVWSGIILAITKYELGDSESCFNLLQLYRQRQWEGSTYARYQALCLEAWVELNTTSEKTIKLEETFSLASRQNFIFLPLVGRAIFIELCQRALHFGIEINYVRSIISEHFLTPDNPFCTSHLWPFPLKVYTLQPFKIVITTRQGESEISLQQKPLELLKVLIALGGYNVSVEKICDTLWQDADGDAAYKSLKTTLYRLRKSLGSENYIIAKNNTLSLSNDCWVDALCILNDQSLVSSKKQVLIRELVSLYRLPFLYEDNDVSWVIPSQLRISRSMIRLLDYIATTLLQQKKPEEAINYFEQALEIDPFDGSHYIGLMECFHSMRRQDQIHATYQRYVKVYESSNLSSNLDKCYETLMSHYS